MLQACKDAKMHTMCRQVRVVPARHTDPHMDAVSSHFQDMGCIFTQVKLVRSEILQSQSNHLVEQKHFLLKLACTISMLPPAKAICFSCDTCVHVYLCVCKNICTQAYGHQRIIRVCNLQTFELAQNSSLSKTLLHLADQVVR